MQNTTQSPSPDYFGDFDEEALANVPMPVGSTPVPSASTSPHNTSHENVSFGHSCQHGFLLVEAYNPTDHGPKASDSDIQMGNIQISWPSAHDLNNGSNAEQNIEFGETGGFYAPLIYLYPNNIVLYLIQSENVADLKS
jgi:hypothetical protein